MSGGIVVKIAVDCYVIFEIRHNLVDIDNRVEYDCVGSADYAERERREIIIGADSRFLLSPATLCAEYGAV